MTGSSGKAHVLVEGQGDVAAVGNLLVRLSADRNATLTWSTPVRWPNLHLEQGLRRGAEFVRAKPDVSALLVLRDEDDACPRYRGPEMAAWLRRLGLPFPSAVVLLHPEYEVVFLPCLDLMAGKLLDGRPGLDAGTVWDGVSWQARRGVKEWLSHHFPRNRRYKPTLDQLPMTRMVDFDRLRRAEVPCFGTLERAVTFLDRARNAGDVYPS